METRLKFIKDLEIYQYEKPFECDFDVSKFGPDARRTNVEYEECNVLVHDIRGREGDFKLNHNGFEIIRKPSEIPLEDLMQDDIVQNGYFEEVAEILKTRLNAARVHIFHYERRDNRPQGEYLLGSSKPVNIAHIDQSQDTLKLRVLEHFGDAEGLTILENHKVEIVNAWRAILGPINDMPLAFCDTRSVKTNDCVAVDNVRLGTRVGENLIMRHNKDQRWYYISRQMPDEMWLFFMSGWDPANPGRIPQGDSSLYYSAHFD
ncbi:hypothetical protein BDV96DRAFT_654288 [Lophiotrema nucula]|uniref:CmcJ-like methyltransferase n=1 Tax=Lophiotrema nucula TaxID=690887 RepID=A0A6A5YLB0_9PLEO|nr:hypothetical protein BDV96DRAFT_654288 [Lophiotrema nucula]